MKLAIAFTNFGPYHLARLRALGESLASDNHRLVAHEIAGAERKYPWDITTGPQSFHRVTLFPDRPLEDLSTWECRAAMIEALDHDQPDVVAICGYARPESMAALGWAEANGKPTILMSESQRIDRPRSWWRETIKKRRVRRFSSALVGGVSHREYLIELGMPASRISLGYNAVDNGAFAALAAKARSDPSARRPPVEGPYFLSVSRFVAEKNLPALIRAYASYRVQGGERPWPLVLCGGGPGESEVKDAIRLSGMSEHIHTPGFLQGLELATLYAHAGAFVLPSLSEPWGLVANEAAACGLPLLISERAGCAASLVPAQTKTGYRFAPQDESQLATLLLRLARLPVTDRETMGQNAAATAAQWGPSRFASGMREAIELSLCEPRSRRSPSTPRSITGHGG